MHIDDLTLANIFSKIMDRFDKLDKTLEAMSKFKEIIDGDDWLDNQDLCNLLGVTKRTLARYRQKNIISYYLIGRKTKYKASDVKRLMEEKKKNSPVFKG